MRWGNFAAAMYTSLIIFHSLFRWLVLGSLLFAIYRAATGLRSDSSFSKTDNAVRHWTATIAHIQLAIGITLYIKSPVIQYFLKHFSAASKQVELLFFGIIHFLLMFVAVVVITIGSAMAKRKKLPREQYRTMLVWFTVGLVIILLAIPWPFSPLASRPLWRW